MIMILMFTLTLFVCMNEVYKPGVSGKVDLRVVHHKAQN